MGTEDALSFTNQGNITGSFSPGGDTLTLTGPATLAQFEAAIRSVTYTNNSEAPNTGTRTVSFTVNDGEADSNTQTRDITVESVNDDPTNVGTLPSDITVTEDVASDVDLSAVDFSDVDAGSGAHRHPVDRNRRTADRLDRRRRHRRRNRHRADLYRYAGGPERLLRRRREHPVRPRHAEHQRRNADTITVVINDNGNTGTGGGADQALGTVNVDITAVNDEEVLATNTGATVAEASIGNVISSTQLQTTDVDNTNAELVYTVDAVPGNGTLRLNGAALENQRHVHPSGHRCGLCHYDHDGSETSSDSFNFTVDDGAGSTTPGTFNFTVTAVNDAPVAANIENTDAAYVENAAPVQVTNAITFSDVDDTDLESATVQITGGFVAPKMFWRSPVSLTSRELIDGITGILALSGSATLAEYQTVIRSVTYANTSDNPNTADRTVSFTVNDGDLDSNTQTRDITIEAVNDDPTNAGTLPSDITVTEDVASDVDLSAVDFSDVDAGSGSLTVTLSTATGGQLTASTDGGVTVGGTATALTFTGSQADLDAYFDVAANIQYVHGTPNTNGDDADTITVVINDNGNTGTGGGADQALGTVNVDITAVNDEEVLATNVGATVAEGFDRQRDRVHPTANHRRGQHRRAAGLHRERGARERNVAARRNSARSQ